MRTTYDVSPLFRTAVGFDRISRILNDSARCADSDLSYPPYDIEQKDADHYRVTMAVAGFKPEEIDVVLHENTLTVSSSAKTKTDEDGKTLLYKGIAKRSFKRRFLLADFIQVEYADLENGLLTVDLAREVPEEKKPRRIEICGTAKLENKAA